MTPKIYVANYCKIYHVDGKHHEINQRPAEEAMKLVTDEKIQNGEICDQTIIDMRDCIIELLKK